jgi:hypothetical protein
VCGFTAIIINGEQIPQYLACRVVLAEKVVQGNTNTKHGRVADGDAVWGKLHLTVPGLADKEFKSCGTSTTASARVCCENLSLRLETILSIFIISRSQFYKIQCFEFWNFQQVMLRNGRCSNNFLHRSGGCPRTFQNVCVCVTCMKNWKNFSIIKWNII